MNFDTFLFGWGLGLSFVSLFATLLFYLETSKINYSLICMLIIGIMVLILNKVNQKESEVKNGN